MPHYKDIDTNWDDPHGWGRHTIPFLNQLHPITGNLVEHAVRVQHSYQYPIIQEFIHKADRHIRKILESSKQHDQKKFKIENYSKEDLAKVADYVRNLLRFFRTYYQTADENQWYTALKCVDMNIGQLANMLDRIQDALEYKLAPICLTEDIQNDIRNLVSLMNILEREHLENEGEVIDTDSHVVYNENEIFENPMLVFPPPQLENIVTTIDINCADIKQARLLLKQLKKVGAANYSIREENGSVSIGAWPAMLTEEDTFTIAAINGVMGGVKKVLAENSYQESQTWKDTYGWKHAGWKIAS